MQKEFFGYKNKELLRRKTFVNKKIGQQKIFTKEDTGNKND